MRASKKIYYWLLYFYLLLLLLCAERDNVVHVHFLSYQLHWCPKLKKKCGELLFFIEIVGVYPPTTIFPNWKRDWGITPFATSRSYNACEWKFMKFMNPKIQGWIGLTVLTIDLVYGKRSMFVCCGRFLSYSFPEV